MDILKHIPYGKKNAISKITLMALTGLDERTIRRELKNLLKQGIPILSSSHSRGYWISDDLDEIEQYIKETDNRRRSLYYTTLALRKEYYRRRGIKATVVKEHIRRNDASESIPNGFEQLSLDDFEVRI